MKELENHRVWIPQSFPRLPFSFIMQENKKYIGRNSDFTLSAPLTVRITLADTNTKGYPDRSKQTQTY